MPFTEALCPKFQEALIEVAKGNTGYVTRSKTGFLDSLVSRENKQNFSQITLDAGNGGTRVVELTFIQPSLPSAVVTTKQDVCAAGAEVPPFAQIINPTSLQQLYTPAKTLYDAEVAKICFNSTAEYKANMIMAEINALNIRLDQALLSWLHTPPAPALASPLLGQIYDGITLGNVETTPLPVTLIGSTPGTPQPLYANWANFVRRQFRRIRQDGRPIVVGAGDFGIESYAELLNVACCNSEGIDASKAGNQMAYFYDLDADNFLALGGGPSPNYFVAYSPGALQLITYYEYGGVRNKRLPDAEMDVITDPFTGITYDFKAVYDKCTEAWTMSLGIRYMLWGLPINMYQLGDPMEGVTNVLLFEATL